MSNYQDALKALQRSQPKSFEPVVVDGFSSGSLALDQFTGIGGFPRGRLTVVCGWEASGKTTLCLGAFAAAQRQGLQPVYLDTELGVDQTYAEAIGCDFTDHRKGLYATPATFDDALDIIGKLVHEVPIIFIDSVSGLVTKDALEKDLGNTEAIGLRARMFSNVLPVLTKLMRESNTAVVLVNQLRENITTDVYQARFAPKHKSQGGRAIPYFAWLRVNTVQVKKSDTKVKRISPLSGKEEEVPVASEHSFQILKSKVSVAYQQVPFYIRFDPELGTYGVDNLQTLMNMATAAGMITKKGSYYNLKVEGMGEAGTFATQGEESLYRHLASSKALIEGLAAALNVDWSLYGG